jgi:hypothetical protein
MADVGALVWRLLADVSGMRNEVTQLTQHVTGQFSALEAKASALGGAFGRMFSVAAVAYAVKATAQYADSLDEMATGAGVTVEALQELGYAASQNGSDLEKMVSGLQIMGEKIGSGDKGLAAAVKSLGLSFDAIRQASPDQAFQQIAAALAALEDSNTRNALAADIFGKSWKNLMPTVMSDIQALRTEAPKMSEATVKAMGASADSIDRVIAAGKTLIGSVLAPFTPEIENVTSAVVNMTSSWREFGAVMMTLVSPGSAVAGSWAKKWADDAAGRPPALPGAPTFAIAPGLPKGGPGMPSADDQAGLDLAVFDAVHALGEIEWVNKLYQEAITEEIKGWEEMNQLARDNAKILRDQVVKEMQRMLELTNQTVEASLRIRDTKISLFERLGMDASGAMLPQGQDLELYKLDQAKRQELNDLEAQARDSRHPVTGQLGPGAQQDYDAAKAAIDAFYEQKYREVLDKYSQSVVSAAGAADTFASAAGRAAVAIGGRAPVSGSGAGAARGITPNGDGSFSVPSLSPQDWQIYHSSLNAALYGKGMSPDAARMIYGPTVFPFGSVGSFAKGGYASGPTLAVVGDSPGGEFMVPAGRMGRGGPVNVAVHSTVNYPILNDARSSDELTSMLEKLIQQAMARAGLTVR